MSKAVGLDQVPNMVIKDEKEVLAVHILRLMDNEKRIPKSMETRKNIATLQE